MPAGVAAGGGDGKARRVVGSLGPQKNCEVGCDALGKRGGSEARKSGEPGSVCILIAFCGCTMPTHAMKFLWRSEDSYGSQISPSTMGVLRIELRPVWGLLTSTFLR